MPLMGSMALSVSALLAAETARVPDVVWMDLAGVPALVQEAALREAGAVLREAGLAPRWRVGRAHDLIGSRELTVVLLPRDHSARREVRVLGACMARPGAARMWVYLDAVEFALGLPAGGLPRTAEEAFRLGRAIGRIVAHELIHAIAPEVSHARGGIMAARLGRGALMAARLAVDAATRRRLHSALNAATGAGS